MLDFPAPVDSFHHELGVHEKLHFGGAEFSGAFNSAQQTVVFGDVVGGLLSHHVDDFIQDGFPVGSVDDGAGTGRAGVAA